MELVCNAPIFVVGANRSGTTLMRLLLNAHSHIAIPEELTYIKSYIEGVPIETWRDLPWSPGRYTAFVSRFLDKGCRLLGGLDVDQLREEILLGPADFKRPYEAVLSAWARHHGKPRWGEKTPGNLFYADILLEMFPEARFIQMIRDPRAGISSMQRTPFFSDDIIFNALAWHKQVTAGRRHFEKSVPASQRLTVQYEALVHDPEETMRAVCRFLGEAFEPGMLSFHQTAHRFMKAEAATGFNVAATQPITPHLIDRWREHLGQEEVAVIEAVCREEMEASGYAFEQVGLGWRARGEVWIKRIYTQIQGWRHRHIRHYTVRDRLFARSRTRVKKLFSIRG